MENRIKEERIKRITQIEIFSGNRQSKVKTMKMLWEKSNCGFGI